MYRHPFYLLLGFLLISGGQIIAQDHNRLPIDYEELTAPEFVKAVELSQGVCLLPMGILEKHGPHLPLGTDLLNVRELCSRAARKEFALVFPQYYAGQIFEAKHQPGTIAYSPELIWKLLQETCDELGRNGVKKIILVNGHGGNSSFLPYFCQAQLDTRKDYSVFLYRPVADSALEKKISSLKRTANDGHAGEAETSRMSLHRPDLAHSDRADEQSGGNLARLSNIDNAFTGIWWYARYPNHYAGDGSVINKELAELSMASDVEQLAALIREVKQDTNAAKLQKMFFDQSADPLKTKQ
jgi:creatinine amidohydrolase